MRPAIKSGAMRKTCFLFLALLIALVLGLWSVSDAQSAAGEDATPIMDTEEAPTSSSATITITMYAVGGES